MRMEISECHCSLELGVFHSCYISLHFIIVPFLYDFFVVIFAFCCHVFAL